MKILQLYEFFSLIRGGGSVDTLYRLSKTLAQRGHEVTIYTSDFELDRELVDSIKEVKVHPFHSWLNPLRVPLVPDLVPQIKRTLMEFATFKKGMVRKTTSTGRHSFSMSNSALTPLLVLTYHQNKFYHGMSNLYRITVSDDNMKKELTFGLIRKKKPVPAGFKDKVLEGTYQRHSKFWICSQCSKIYWQGSHWKKINETLEKTKTLLIEKKSIGDER